MSEREPVRPEAGGTAAARPDPVFDPALAEFQAQEGRYPEMLEELVPAYLTSLPTEVNDMEIIYRLDGESYSLEFSYAGPGMNHCSYTPEKGWKCYGFY